MKIYDVGDVLREIRIKRFLTLRQFCLNRELDPMRYSLIERNELKPTDCEIWEYIALIPQGSFS